MLPKSQPVKENLLDRMLLLGELKQLCNWEAVSECVEASDSAQSAIRNFTTIRVTEDFGN